VRLFPARSALLCAACLAFAGPAFSQAAASDSSVDQLFEAPQEDTETQSSDARQLLKAFHAQPLTVTGSFTSMAGLVTGYTDGKDSSGNYNGSYEYKTSPGLNFVPSLTFSARPDQTIRFQGTVSFPFASANMFEPAINEMFFDYTLQDMVYLRIGRHLVSWGVTRIFDAGGDLMAKSSDGLDFKATVPIGSGGVTAIVLTPQSIFTDTFLWKDMTYGLQADLPIGASELILSGTYYGSDVDSTPLRATAVLKTSIFGVDLFAEGIGASTFSWGSEVNANPALSGVVSGFFWERIDPEFRLYGEYYYDATDTSKKSQFVSLVAGANKAFGSPLNLGLQWTHAFKDNSGIVVPGFSVNLWPHTSMQIGFPFRYGAPGSFYLTNQSPSVQTSVVPNQVMQWYQRYGFLLRLNLSTSF
jgi:hypothetical protein